MLLFNNIFNKELFKLKENSFNLSKIIKYIGFIYLICFFEELAYSMFMVIESFINKQIFNQDVLNNLTSEITNVHAILLTMGFLLTTLMLFKRNITILNVVIIAFVSNNGFYQFLDMTVHPFLMQIGIFNSMLRPGETQINPQYTRLILFLISSVLLFVVVVIKKTRTFDRSFMLFITWALVITTSLFHIAIPMGTLRYTKNEKLEEFVTEVKSMPINFTCRDKFCFFYDKNWSFLKTNTEVSEDINLKQKMFLGQAQNFYLQNKDINNVLYKTDGDFIGIKMDFLICVKKESEYLCVIKENAMKNHGRHSQLWFAFLTSMAHIVWIFGGLTLLGLHKNRKIKKLLG